MRTLTSDEGLANSLSRHFLAAPGDSVGAVADALVGLHNTSPITPYLSLNARLEGFERSHLETAMWEEWSLARLRAMRLTMFIFTRGLLEIAGAATRGLKRKLAQQWLRDSDLTAGEFDAIAQDVLEALRDGPLTVRGLRKALGLPVDVDLPGVVGRLADTGHVAGGISPRSWKSPVRQYHLWDQVLPGVDLSSWGEDEAIQELIGRYVRSYGPVSMGDISWWSGFPKGVCQQALAHGLDIREVEVAGWPRPLYADPDLSTDLEADVVNVLPLLDPYVQGYKDRGRFLDTALHAHVYDKGGNSSATIVRRGRIVGVWQTVEQPESIRYHLFEDHPAPVIETIEAGLTAMGELRYDQEVEVIPVDTMRPLHADGGRSAAHPLENRPWRPKR